MENDEFEKYMTDLDPDMVFYELFDVYNPIDNAVKSNTNLQNVKAVKDNNCYYIDIRNGYENTINSLYGLKFGFYDRGAILNTINLVLKDTYPDLFRKLNSYY